MPCPLPFGGGREGLRATKTQSGPSRLCGKGRFHYISSLALSCLSSPPYGGGGGGEAGRGREGLYFLISSKFFVSTLFADSRAFVLEDVTTGLPNLGMK